MEEIATFVPAEILARSAGLLVSDNALRKAMEVSLLTSAIYFLPREGLLRQKRRELAAVTEK